MKSLIVPAFALVIAVATAMPAAAQTESRFAIGADFLVGASEIVHALLQLSRGPFHSRWISVR